MTARIPTRTNHDDRYFTNNFQQMPADGDTAMVRNILDHPSITVHLGRVWNPDHDRALTRRVIFTGPIDVYFQRRHGPLPYRSRHFVPETLDVEWAQPLTTINHPQTEDHTRITEYKHLPG